MALFIKGHRSPSTLPNIGLIAPKFPAKSSFLIISIPESSSALPWINLTRTGSNAPFAHIGIDVPISDSRPSWYPNANLNNISFVFTADAFGRKIFMYSRYFRNQSWLRNPHPLNPVSIMLEHSLAQFLFSQAPPKISDMFSCLVATFTWFSDISSTTGPFPLSSEKTYPIYLPLVSGSAFASLLIRPFSFGSRASTGQSFLLFLPNRTLGIKAICISTFETGRFILGFSPNRPHLFEIAL